MHHFSFMTDGKVVVLGVPIFKHFRVTKVVLCLVGLGPDPGEIF